MARNAASDGASPLLPCFAIHPQLPAVKNMDGEPFTEDKLNNSIEILHTLAEAGRIAAIGEFGFDLYNSAFRETEALQDMIFATHLETALRYDLPVVLHVRRACVKYSPPRKLYQSAGLSFSIHGPAHLKKDRLSCAGK